MTKFRPGDKELLLVVDGQNDFCPDGVLAVPDGDAVVPMINLLAAAFSYVAMTQDWHPSDHRLFAVNHPERCIEAVNAFHGSIGSPG
jgi:nicotinamidase/pyrazinamidase